MRDAFIREHREQWPVSVLWEVLKVSRSGYYASVNVHPMLSSSNDLELLTRVRAIDAATGQCYGSRRMAKALQAEGYQVGRYKAHRLMKEAGVSVKRRTMRKPQTTDSRHDYKVAPNIVNREFDVAQPNAVWVGDLTYLWTQEGWLYLAVLLDL